MQDHRDFALFLRANRREIYGELKRRYGTESTAYFTEIGEIVAGMYPRDTAVINFVGNNHGDDVAVFCAQHLAESLGVLEIVDGNRNGFSYRVRAQLPERYVPLTLEVHYRPGAMILSDTNLPELVKSLIAAKELDRLEGVRDALAFTEHRISSIDNNPEGSGIIYYRFEPGDEELAWMTFNVARSITPSWLHPYDRF